MYAKGVCVDKKAIVPFYSQAHHETQREYGRFEERRGGATATTTSETRNRRRLGEGSNENRDESQESSSHGGFLSQAS